AAGVTTQNLVASLNQTRRVDAHLQLIQLGPREGRLATRLVAPTLTVAPIDTHLLGELTVANDVVLSQLVTPPAGMLSPVHPMAHGVDVAPPVLRRADTVGRVVDPRRVLGDFHRVSPTTSDAGFDSAPVHLANLLTSVGDLHDGRTLGRPARGEAFVLRIASYVGEQLVGGYTLVVGG